MGLRGRGVGRSQTLTPRVDHQLPIRIQKLPVRSQPVAVVCPSRADVRCWCNPVEDARRCRDAAFALIYFAPAEVYPLSATC